MSDTLLGSMMKADKRTRLPRDDVCEHVGNETDMKNPIKRSPPYVQSPIDDSESFFHTTLWAVLFNNHNTPCKVWRDRVAGSQGARTIARGDILGWPPTVSEPNDIVTEPVPVLYDWFNRLTALRWVMKTMMIQASRFSEEDKVVEFIECSWHIIAIRGVCDFLEVMKAHREQL